MAASDSHKRGWRSFPTGAEWCRQRPPVPFLLVTCQPPGCDPGPAPQPVPPGAPSCRVCAHPDRGSFVLTKSRTQHARVCSRAAIISGARQLGAGSSFAGASSSQGLGNARRPPGRGLPASTFPSSSLLPSPGALFSPTGSQGYETPPPFLSPPFFFGY